MLLKFKSKRIEVTPKFDEPFTTRETTVNIFAGENKEEEPLATAIVQLHSGDVDDIAIGQKYAFKRLMKLNAFNRTQRIELFNSFWNYSKRTMALRHTW